MVHLQFLRGVFQTHKKLFKCNDGLGHPGQYVYIRDDRKAKEYFGLCEVEVFAYRERIPCGDPEVPTNGGVQREGEDRTRYTCDMGHKLEGDSVLICSSKGEWQGHIPKCKEAKYNCNPGYVLRGPHLRVCGRDGEWLEEPPTCQVVTCGDPPSFANSKYKFLNTSTGQWKGIVVYSCEEGFKFHEDNEDTVTTCLDTGVWTSINVTCVPLITKLDFVVHETKGKSIYDLESTSLSSSPPHLVIILAVIAGILAVGMIIFGVLLIRRRFIKSLGSLNPLVSRSNDSCNGGAGIKTGRPGESSSTVGTMSYLGGYSKPSGLFHTNILQGIANRDYRSRLNYMNRAEDSTSSEGSTTTTEPPYEKVRSEHSYETLRKKSTSKTSIGGTSSQDTNYESFSTDRESIGYETVAGPKEPGYEVIANPNDPGYEVVKEKETKIEETVKVADALQKEPGYEVVRSENQDPGYEVLKTENIQSCETLRSEPSKTDLNIVEYTEPDIIKNLTSKDSETRDKESKTRKARNNNEIPPEILALYAKVDKTKKNKKSQNPQPPSSPPLPGNHPVLKSKHYKGSSNTIPPGSVKTPASESKNLTTQTKQKTKDLKRKFNIKTPDEECPGSTSLNNLGAQENPSINSQTGSLLRPLPPLPNAL
ncbi:Sushi, von Willebrand factor type A, EGF and pentraxin domain-containing protein 1 [Armadillidium vulgare]|nr:Sushi, von Willebrand factor type A, EGF and pentraxin domain-containing protein 1 [Armadillidium vulgare]